MERASAHKSSVTFWDKALRYPPVLVRLLARHRRGQPLSELEISQRSGLPVHQIHILSQCKGWESVDLLTMQAFLRGCGFDLEKRGDLKRANAYIAEQAKLAARRRANWRYLRVHPDWHTLFEPLMRRYLGL